MNNLEIPEKYELIEYQLYKFYDCDHYAVVGYYNDISRLGTENNWSNAIIHDGGYKNSEGKYWADVANNLNHLIFGYCSDYKIRTLPRKMTIKEVKQIFPEYWL